MSNDENRHLRELYQQAQADTPPGSTPQEEREDRIRFMSWLATQVAEDPDDRGSDASDGTRPPADAARPVRDAEPLLTSAQVASLLRVDPKTLARWAKAGRLTSIRTLGGHRRYRESEVRRLLDRSMDGSAAFRPE